MGVSRVFLGRNRPMYRTTGATDRVFRFTCEIAKELNELSLQVVEMPAPTADDMAREVFLPLAGLEDRPCDRSGQLWLRI